MGARREAIPGFQNGISLHQATESCAAHLERMAWPRPGEGVPEFDYLPIMDQLPVGLWRTQAFRLPNHARQLSAVLFRNVIAAVHDEPWRAFSPSSVVGGPPNRWFPGRNGALRAYVGQVAAAVHDCLESFQRGWLDFQFTRLLLALKAHEAAGGRLPDRLEDLVSDFLSEVLRDPYGGGPLRFDRVQGLLYSVGLDGSNDIGNPEA